MNIREQYEAHKGDVSLKITDDPNLFVLKYRRKVFFDNSWDDFLRECRGLVVDKDFNIVSYPFTKIHNYGIERDAPRIYTNEIVSVMRKVNGYMLAATYHDGKLLLSTTGTIDSEYVKLGWETIRTYCDEDYLTEIIAAEPSKTFMFECVHPKDPHVIYEEPGLYFLGKREKAIGSPIEFLISAVEQTDWYVARVHTMAVSSMSFDNLLDVTVDANHEGFVVYLHRDGRQLSTKLKTPYYLGKKALMRTNFDKLFRKGMRERLPEEFHPLYDFLQRRPENFQGLDEQQRSAVIEAWFQGLKEYSALNAYAHGLEIKELPPYNEGSLMK